ncbi:MAG: MFS transporter [Bacteroidetes bacterium]|nr:MAG: MFS transporter [Bacteroidota bacterium]
MRTRILTRTVWLLGLVSLFTDMASEMLYPVLPLYLESIGFTVVGIGLLEGLAQATAGLSKGYFGKWSDTSGRRLPFVRLGYALSALSKPLMAVWTNGWWIFAARTADRLGKGIRSGARDALLSAEATAQSRGRVFGFHRGMDTLGAAIGPALALLFLWKYPGAYRSIFLLAFIPGLLAVAATFLLKEPDRPVSSEKKRPGFWAFVSYVPRSPLPYRRLLYGLLAFALINSSDMFLLLVLKEKGLSDTALVGFYIFYNLIYALAAYPAGGFADRFGKKTAFVLGIFLFACVYAGMAVLTQWWQLGGLFFLYGLYAAFTEGVAKAWISQLCKAAETATAIGTYDGLSSVAALLASSLAGLLWYHFGPEVLFGTTALLALLLMLYFLALREGG